MADWYVSSAAWALIAQFAASTAYTVGQIVRPLTAPAITAQYAFRCTTAGTSGTEPTWPTGNNSTVTTGGATFTNVTGQSTYNWLAPAGTLLTLQTASVARAVVGDRVILSSDHSESQTASTYNFNTSVHALGLIQIISVNRAGSVPPAASDAQSGATLAVTSGNLVLEAYCNLYWQGVTFALSGSATILYLNSSGYKSQYFRNCAVVFTTSTSNAHIGSNGTVKVTFDNTTVTFSGTGQWLCGNPFNTCFDFTWINTAPAILGTIPNTLFTAGTQSNILVVCRGVDLSPIINTLYSPSASSSMGKVLLECCKIAPNAVRFAGNGATNLNEEMELVNCWDGTKAISERWTAAGSTVVDRVNMLTGGALDDDGSFSLRLVSASQADIQVLPVLAFTIDVENAAVGVSKTATIEVASPLTLNNTDARMLLEYMGTSGDPHTSFVDTLSSTLAVPAALPSSPNTWTTAPYYASWNPQDPVGVNAYLSNNNLTANVTSVFYGGFRGTPYFAAGKFYFEYTITTLGGTTSALGLITPVAALGGGASSVGIIGIQVGGAIFINGTSTGVTITPLSVVGIAIDFGAQLIWFRAAPSGNWNSSGTANPATGVGGLSFSAIAGPLGLYGYAGNSAVNFTINPGSSAFTGAVPSGFAPGLFITPTVKQRLQSSFTPQRAGRVRGLVQFGKPNSVINVNPQISIS